MQNPNEHTPNTDADLDALEADLQQAEPAEAPDKAEEIARLLGNALDDIDGGAGSVTP